MISKHLHYYFWGVFATLVFLYLTNKINSVMLYISLNEIDKKNHMVLISYKCICKLLYQRIPKILLQFFSLQSYNYKTQTFVASKKF